MSDQQEPWRRIGDQPYCDPSKRMDFVLLFDVKDGNPNGDPDAGNLPRMDPANQHGIVTDVCIKRKIRDYLAAILGQPIYIQSEDALNTLFFRAASRVPEAKKHVVEVSVAPDKLKALVTSMKAGKEGSPSDEQLEVFCEWIEALEAEGFQYVPDDGGKLTYFGEAKNRNDFTKLLQGEETPEGLPEKAVEQLARAFADAKRAGGGAKLSKDVRDKVKAKMCELYDDIRLFGAVLTAGTNAGQVRGPMQLTFARSVEPILQMDAAITRCAITREADRTRKQTEFGRKPWLSYAAYRQHGFFNAPLAEKTGVTGDDLARFWEALACMFPNSASASKGEMAMRDIIVFVHASARGNAPSHKLFDRVKCNVDTASGAMLTLEDEDGKKISDQGIKVHRPLNDMWPDL